MSATGRCAYCGDGPNHVGCLVALEWSTDLHGYKWAHWACAEREYLRQRALREVRTA